MLFLRQSIKIRSHVFRSNTSFFCSNSNIVKEEETTKEKENTFIAMSGSGWLLPFYLGAIKALKKHNLITPESKFAGTSGGSLCALIACVDLPVEDALQIVINLSKNKSFKQNISEGMRKNIKDMLIGDEEKILKLCNDRLFVTTTKVWPNPKSSVIITSQYKSIDHIIDTVSASCFIPFYSSSNMRSIKIITEPIENNYIDGGVFAFMPPIGNIKISAIPKRFISLIPGSVDIYLKDKDFRYRDLVKWILFPGPEETLKELFEKGFENTERWILSNKEK